MNARFWPRFCSSRDEHGGYGGDTTDERSDHAFMSESTDYQGVSCGCSTQSGAEGNGKSVPLRSVCPTKPPKRQSFTEQAFDLARRGGLRAREGVCVHAFSLSPDEKELHKQC